MQDYELFKFDNDINEKVIFIKTTEDLYFLQDSIFDDLSIMNGEKFTILVDLFLRNGFSFNRFVALNYKGKDQCISYIINPRDVSDEIKLTIKNYLKIHKEILENSALTKSTINFVITGNI